MLMILEVEDMAFGVSRSRIPQFIHTQRPTLSVTVEAELDSTEAKNSSTPFSKSIFDLITSSFFGSKTFFSQRIVVDFESFHFIYSNCFFACSLFLLLSKIYSLCWMPNFVIISLLLFLSLINFLLINFCILFSHVKRRKWW